VKERKAETDQTDAVGQRHLRTKRRILKSASEAMPELELCARVLLYQLGAEQQHSEPAVDEL